MSMEYPCVYFEKDGKCRKFSDENTTSYCVMGPCPDETPTNADRIRTMTDEDLVSFLWEVFEAGIEDALYYQQGRKCSFEWTEDWLQQPAKED